MYANDEEESAAPQQCLSENSREAQESPSSSESEGSIEKTAGRKLTHRGNTKDNVVFLEVEQSNGNKLYLPVSSFQNQDLSVKKMPWKMQCLPSPPLASSPEMPSTLSPLVPSLKTYRCQHGEQGSSVKGNSCQKGLSCLYKGDWRHTKGPVHKMSITQQSCFLESSKWPRHQVHMARLHPCRRQSRLLLQWAKSCFTPPPLMVLHKSHTYSVNIKIPQSLRRIHNKTMRPTTKGKGKKTQDTTQAD